MQENTLKCMMKTLFLPEKGCVCLRNNYHYQPQHTAMPRKTPRHAEKGRTALVSLLISFILTWGVLILSQVGYNFVHYFKGETNAIFSALCMPEVRSKYLAMEPGVAVPLLGKRYATC